MRLGIVRLYTGESGKIGYYNIQEIGLAKALEKRGIETDIFFLVNKKENKRVVVKNISENIRVIYIPAFKLFNHGIKSPKFLLEYNLDIVHLLSDNQLMTPTFVNFLKKNNVPVYCYVGTIKSDSINKFKKSIMNIISKNTIKSYNHSLVVAKTPLVQEELIKRNVCNTRVIPVGLDLDVIPYITSKSNILREELGLPVDKKILIFVGRLEVYKNPEKAIELLNKLIKINNNYFLIIIGQGSLKNRVIDMIKDFDITNNVKMIEQVKNTEIHKYYKVSDIFINLNDKEIFGMSILEAMYQQCKVIAVNAPGPNFIIENGVSGILIDGFDSEFWIEKIIDVADKNEVGLNAKQRISNKLNWDVISNNYINLFKELMGDFDEKM